MMPTDAMRWCCGEVRCAPQSRSVRQAEENQLRRKRVSVSDPKENRFQDTGHV